MLFENFEFQYIFSHIFDFRLPQNPIKCWYHFGWYACTTGSGDNSTWGSDEKIMKNILKLKIFKQNIFCIYFVHKIMLTKYEMLTPVQLRYLACTKWLHLTLASADWIRSFEHFSLTHLAKAV